MQTFKPLAGVRVLSFELAFSLPSGTRALHDMGADVVRVSPPERSQDRYISVIDGVFHGKRCISIDLTTESGRDIACRLADQADVVCSNFRPHVLGKYGLDADTLRRQRPELICLQVSGYGTPGPWSEYPAFGPSTEAAGGLTWLMAPQGERPARLGTGVFSDQLSGRHSALAVVAALRKRQESGRGATIDHSMTAAISHLIGIPLTRAGLTGEVPDYRPNRDSRYVPQGIYPARGTDEWIAISTQSDAAWHALAELIGLDPALSKADRQAAHDAIDAALARWTAGFDKDELTERLQSLGVAAAPVRTVRDTNSDPQFAARGALQMVRHRRPKLGHDAHPHPPLPWRIVGRNRRRVTDYRHTGQDNRAVMRDWLAMDDAAVTALERSGALTKAPPLELAERPASALRDADFASKAGLE